MNVCRSWIPAWLLVSAATLIPGGARCQTPTVGGLLNNYSFTLPGLPNYGIAQGSIFDIFGTNLSSTTTPLQSPPLESPLDGTTISVTVNGTTTNPLIYFLSSGQIAAVLPSATPVGTGTITVTTALGTSAGFPIQVVESAFGLLPVNNGSGPVAGFDANNNYAFLGPTAAANPGDILELWGSGLGPVPGDGTLTPVSAPIEVDIGGVPATVSYHGRSQFAGLDQINVQVPAGVSGCNVSVAVVTGSYVSNFGTLPVAASGRTCTDANSLEPAPILADIAKTGSYTIGDVLVTETVLAGSDSAPATAAIASFGKVTASQLVPGAIGGTTSIGSCYVSTKTSGSAAKVTFLNAGPDIDANGPRAQVAIPYDAGIYVSPTDGPPFVGATGSVSFNNGSGGPDVGPFSVTVPMPVISSWTNVDGISAITRSKGQTVTWTGGDPNTYMTVSGISFAEDDVTVSGAFGCAVPTSAGTFTIPASVLLSLPASGAGAASLILGNTTNAVAFTAPNIDFAYGESIYMQAIYVTYQ